VVAARPGLGTISHTLLTLEAARTAGLKPMGVVMTPWPEADDMARSNRETVERIGDVRVSVLPRVTRDELASAGGELPLDDWLS
jgi:dethiobiotin synthetase